MIEEIIQKTLSEMAEYSRIRENGSVRLENERALCWYLARKIHFGGNERKAAAWVRSISKIQDASEISRNMSIGGMIDFFHDNNVIFEFLLSFPNGKNMELIQIPFDRLNEFLEHYTCQYLSSIGRDDVRKLVDKYLGRNKSKKPEEEKLFQPDLFGCIEKTAKTDDPEDFRRAMERIEKKNKLESFRKAFYLQARLMCYDKELATIEGSKEALDAVLSLLDQVKAKDQSESTLPVKSESMPPAIRKERREVTIEDLNEKQLLCRDQRYHFVKSVYDKIAGGVRTEEAVKIIDTEAGDSLELARTYGRNGGPLIPRNYYQWMNLLGKDENGLPDWSNNFALAPRQTGRQSAGKNGPEEFWKILHSIYQHRNRIGIAECYRQAVKLYRRDYPESAAALPNENHCRYWLEKTDPRITVLTRDGETAFKNTVAPYIRRDWSNVFPNQCWYADHRKFDFMARVYDENKGCWIAVRPWICAFTDAKSWKYMAWRIVADGINSKLVINTFAEAIFKNGEPESVYFDNGGDFQKTGFSTPVQFKPDGPEFSILGALGIKLHTAAPYNGRAKTVERIFGYQSGRFDKKFAAYLGNTPLVRPENTEMYAKSDYVMALPTLQQVAESFEMWLEEYHNYPNRGKILNGRILSAGEGGTTPLQAYNMPSKIQRPVRTLEEYKALFRLPLAELRTVQRGACVIVDKEAYYSDELYPYLGKGRCILIKTDLQDKNRVFAYTTEGRLIAECIKVGTIPALAETEEERKLLADGMKQQADSLKNTHREAAALTGGQLEKFSLEQLEQATTEQMKKLLDGKTRPRIEGEYHSVKGDHNAKIYRLPGSDPLPENNPTPSMPEESTEAEQAQCAAALAGMYDD